MEDLSHRPADSIIGRKISTILPFLQEKVAQVLHDGRKRSIRNFRSTCLMGTNLASHISIEPVRNDKGDVVEVVVSFNGVSGVCPLRKKLSDSDEKMIAIGKIASSLAHGVRNPLNAIKGAVVYLREKYGHETTLLEFSTIINDEINKLDTFISNFLSATTGDMRFAPVRLNDVLKRILAMVKPRAVAQHIAIAQGFSDLPVISADPFQIEQALFNIVNNAMEAMPKGGTLEVKTSLKWEKDKDFVSIKISDTGKGIPRKRMHDLGKISENRDRTDRGFGIFLSREIIKSHNGRLLWESISGKGTTFRILLPVLQQPRE